MKTHLNLLFLFCFSFFVVTQQANASGDTVVIAGTGDSQSLLRLLADSFMEQYPQHTIEVPDSVGSGGGIKQLLHNKCTLARTARHIKEKEQDGTLVEQAFALSPVALVTHPSVTGVTELSSTQITDIFSGKIDRWSQVGGPDQPVYPVDREPGDSSRSILEQQLQGFKSLKSIAKIFYSTPETAEAITRNRNTIGYLPLPIALQRKLNILAIDGIHPSQQTIEDRTYPYFSTFFLISRKNLTSQGARQFIEFISTPTAQALIEKNGLIAINNTP